MTLNLYKYYYFEVKKYPQAWLSIIIPFLLSSFLFHCLLSVSPPSILPSTYFSYKKIIWYLYITVPPWFLDGCFYSTRSSVILVCFTCFSNPYIYLPSDLNFCCNLTAQVSEISPFLQFRSFSVWPIPSLHLSLLTWQCLFLTFYFLLKMIHFTGSVKNVRKLFVFTVQCSVFNFADWLWTVAYAKQNWNIVIISDCLSTLIIGDFHFSEFVNAIRGEENSKGEVWQLDEIGW